MPQCLLSRYRRHVKPFCALLLICLTAGLSGARGGPVGSIETTRSGAPEESNAAASGGADDAERFVTQHYIDFLNRAPDRAGLAFWTHQITECETTLCAARRRVNVSAAFFLSGEFQQTGYFVYLVHQAAFDTGERLALENFLADTEKVGSGVVAGEAGWEKLLEDNKREFVAEFVARESFLARYPPAMSAAQFVDALNANAGAAVTNNQRADLINRLNAGTLDRAGALRAVAENVNFARREFNKAFVLTQYFGYLRRNPNDAPEQNRDFAGYNFWLTKLKEHGGDFESSDMVRSFVDSAEYRQRFEGPRVTLFGNRNDPLLLRRETLGGDILDYFVEKDADGFARALTAARIRNSGGESSLFMFDAQGRPVLMEAASGVVFHVEWKSTDDILLTATSPGGEIQLPVPLTLPAVNAAASVADSGAGGAIDDSSHTAQGTSAATAATVKVTRCKASESIDDALVNVRFGDGPTFDSFPARLKEGGGVYEVPVPLPDLGAGGKIKGKVSSARSALMSVCDGKRGGRFLAPAVREALAAAVAHSAAAYSEGRSTAGGEAVKAAVPILTAALEQLCAGDNWERSVSAIEDRGDAPSAHTLQATAKVDGTMLVGDPVAAPASDESARHFNLDFPCTRIDRLEIGPRPNALHIGEVSKFVAAAKDASGAVVSVPLGRLRWSVAGSPTGTAAAAAARVDETGNVTGVGTGEVIVGVTETRSGKSAVVPLTVHAPAEQIEIAAASTTLDIGESVRLTATAKDAQGNAIAVPAADFRWQTTDASLASVDAAGRIVEARGLSGGFVVVNVTEAKSGKSAAVQLKIRPRIVRVDVTPANSSVSLCDAAQLTATGHDAQGKTYAAPLLEFRWQAEDGVVSVDGDGKVTGNLSGTTRVTATETKSGKSAAVNINVGGGPFTVLNFDGTPKSVDYSYFWNEGVNYGNFFWEFWAMPGEEAGGTYLLSDGYGGGHALLFGFSSYGAMEPGRYQFYGNIFDGARVTNFTSDEGPAPYEWGHFAVGWDGQTIVIYLNGVPVGRKAFAGPRRTPGYANGGGRLLIGGSDHNNLVGRIAQVRGFEGSNPRTGAGGSGNSSVFDSFAPQTVFAGGGNLTSNFFCPRNPVIDLSQGFEGSPRPGRLRGTHLGILQECDFCPLPKFMTDATAPAFFSAHGFEPVPTDAASTSGVPDGARVFDSFSRPNSTYTLGGAGGLGSTEGGTAGPLVWKSKQSLSGLKPFGILNERAVLLANALNVAWVETASSTANLDIRVDRRNNAPSGSGMHTGISFRVVDQDNFFYAYTSDGVAPVQGVLTVGYFSDGVRHDLAKGVNLPNNWTTLRVLTNDQGGIGIFAGEEFVYSAVDNLMATATGVGLFNNSSGMGLANRWDNFTVYERP